MSVTPSPQPSSTVYLVGAGPGDPELLTVRALRLLQQADVVLHDALIDPRVLALASNARLIDVGKRACRPSTAQRFINRALVASARTYKTVVRLKGGDPAIFGRLDEETAALRAAGLAFEVVPGVTAACAAAASLGASLTLRGIARSVRFITPRVAADLADAPYGALSGVSASGETLVVYMAGQLLEELARRLVEAGHTPTTPVVVVESASLPNERSWSGRLLDVAQWPGAAHGGPVLVLIGEALARAVATHVADAPVARAA